MLGNVDMAEVILYIPAEGASLTLLGRRDSESAWTFSRYLNNQTPTLLSEEDAEV